MKNQTPYAPYRPHRFTTADYTREQTYRLTRAPVEWASTLVPEVYHLPEFYALEQERVFAGSWVTVGCTSQVQKPGDILVAKVAGQSIIVTRDNTGELRAFYNVCRHRGTQLFDEPCHVNVIRCPYHSWGYDLTGKCIGTPLFEGSTIPPDSHGLFEMTGLKAFDRADYGLLPVHVEAWGCLVLVNLNPQAQPLSDWIGDLPVRLGGYQLAEWSIQRHKTYHFGANWKLVAENFMEYYHLPWVHPELIKVSRVEDHYRYQGPGMYTGMTTSPVSPNTESGGWLALPPKKGLSAADAVSARFIWLFPNVAISVLPNHVFIMMVTPEGPAHTVEETYLLSHPDSMAPPDAEGELDNLAGFWDRVNQQDIWIVERVQAGLAESAAYTGGRMCYRFEEPLHRFQNMVIDRMVGVARIPPGDLTESAPVPASAK
jgi:choline monooxygenase